MKKSRNESRYAQIVGQPKCQEESSMEVCVLVVMVEDITQNEKETLFQSVSK